MGTTVRPYTSGKNPNYISKHRYYELKHFCLQYNDWKRELASLTLIQSVSNDIRVTTSNIPDPTWNAAEASYYYKERMEMVERAAEETDPYLGNYILLGVTQDLSYEKLMAEYTVPCCKEVYYRLYRAFFKRLDYIRE